MKRIALAIVAAVAALTAYARITAQSKPTPAAFANEWPTYGHDSGGQRFSPLTQVTPANVDRLQVAWVYHMRPAPVQEGVSGSPAVPQGRGGGRGGSNFASSETTPIVIDGVMYISTPYGRVVALDSTIGREIWSFKVPSSSPSTRGVQYWPGDAETPPQIVFGSDSGRLYSLNAKTGEPNPSFGDHGSVDLNTPEILRGLSGSDGLGSPPACLSQSDHHRRPNQENPPLGPAGDVRAWDVHSGKLVWTFRSIPGAGEKFNDTWAGESWKNRSGVNVWGFITVDIDRGIVYMPFGAPSVDQYGGDREGDNLFGTSIVAADANTGKYLGTFRWFITTSGMRICQERQRSSTSSRVGGRFQQSPLSTSLAFYSCSIA